LPTITLSGAAQDLLRRRLADEWVEVTDETRPLYRELVEAGLMIPLHSFARGAEGAYRLTEAACVFRAAQGDDVTFPAIPSPSA
jgi:hypothetical protein